MSKLIFVCAVLAIALCVIGVFAVEPLSEEAYKSLFTQFRNKFGRRYQDSGEEDKRFKNFKVNIDYIREHNANKEFTYKVGMNYFGDLTMEEWSENYKGLIVPENHTVSRPPPSSFNSIVEAKAVDWRTAGVVTPVKNQGSCGSCWAWAVTAAVESAWAINRGELTPLSVQQLVDCNRRNQGCRGGWMTTAFEFILANKGVCPAESYPYQGRQSRCQKCEPSATISSYVDLKGLGENGLTKALNINPVTVAVQSNSRGFMFYKSGIINANCGKSLDHAITAVGYGHDDETNQDYYVIKNSWGTGWGEEGYVRILRNGSSMCGVGDMPSYPVVKGLGGDAMDGSNMSGGENVRRADTNRPNPAPSQPDISLDDL